MTATPHKEAENTHEDAKKTHGNGDGFQESSPISRPRYTARGPSTTKQLSVAAESGSGRSTTEQSGTDESTTGQPNIAVVVLDTARAKDTIPTDPAVTPSLAAIAQGGTEYTNAFASAPWTLPSHASLFTGTYPSTHGAHGEHTHLDGSLETLAGIFSTNGYETVGISNNTWVTGEFGFDRGFDTFRNGWQYVQTDTDHGRVIRAEHPMTKLRAAKTTLTGANPLAAATNIAYSELFQPRGDDGADRTTGWIKAWLADRDSDRPFFLFANYIEPHAEYRPPRRFAEPFLPTDADYDDAIAVRQDPLAFDAEQYDLSDRELELLYGLYRGEIAYLDHHIGRLGETLADETQRRETILVVVGDHGENVGEHGLLGHQYDVSDTLLHVPLVVSGGAFTSGTTNDRLVGTPDLAPTLLDAAGVDARRAREQFEGRSIHPGAGTDHRKQVFAEYIAPQPPLTTLEARFGTLPERLRGADRTLRTVRTVTEKLVRGSDGTTELYDVAEEPDERSDLAAQRPDRVGALGRQLDRWRASRSADQTTTADSVAMTDATKARLADLGYL